MIVLETCLMFLLFAILVYAAYTDCRTSQIHNKLIIRGILAAVALDIPYYLIFARSYFVSFLLNLLMMTLIAFFFYLYHLWAAGDSKLFFVVALCIPGKLYSFWEIGSVPSFVILILVFSIAFIYVIIESIILGVKNKDLFQFSVGEVDYFGVLVSYLAMVAASIIVNWGLWRLFSRQLEYNTVLSFAVSFFVVLTLIQIRNHLDRKGLVTAAAVGWALILLLAALGQYKFNAGVDVRSWIIVLVVMCFRMIAEKYNYKVIPTSEIKAGQILSAVSIAGFRASKVQGLPTGTTEDLRSRLTVDEAESVRRWENSRTGKPYVIIVRKIPFAMFIGIGTALFILIEVALK